MFAEKREPKTGTGAPGFRRFLDPILKLVYYVRNARTDSRFDFTGNELKKMPGEVSFD